MAGDQDQDQTPTINPIPRSLQTYTWLDMSSLWFSVIINVPSYYTASSLVSLGMSWYEALLTIVAGNTILLFPLLLSSHPGPLYGLSFPILLRSSFGIYGAFLPAFLRALVACGWSAVESWIGSQAILLLFPSYWVSDPIPYLGTSLLEFTAFVLFIIAQLLILFKGMNAIRYLGKLSSPLLLILTTWLLIWAYLKAGGFGSMLSGETRLNQAQFWPIFFPSLTASISSWSTIQLNICDFTRFVQSQKDQIFGQIGLPIFVGLYAFASLAITSSTEIIFSRIISNPIELLSEIKGSIFVTLIAVLGITLATISTNIPANFVAPANILVTINPSRFNFAKGALLTAIVSIFFQPWRILSSSESFLYTWLVGYSTIVGPIAGIILADYYIIQRTILDINGLYSTSNFGPYYYVGGFNIRAFIALFLSIVPMIPGFLKKVGLVREVGSVFVVIYDNAWFLGFFPAGIIYLILSCCKRYGNGRLDNRLLDPLSPNFE